MTDRIEGQVVGCMATYPGRFDILRQVVDSLAPQFDRFLIYVNETTEGMPDLSDHPGVIILDGNDHAGNLSANGKIYPLRFLRDCTVFTCDDDIEYPADYVSRCLALLDAFRGRCAVTVHGSVIPEQVDWYYSRLASWPFQRPNRHVQLCNLAGSGTFCFSQRAMDFSGDEALGEVMVDLKLSIAAGHAGLPIWVIPRRERWLKYIAQEGLWERFIKQPITPHTTFSRKQDWSFRKHAGIARRAIDEAGLDAARLGLDPELEHSLRTEEPPLPWRENVRSTAKRVSFLKLVGGTGT